MIIDGKKIRDRIKISLKKEIAFIKRPIILSIISVSSNPISSQFINLKEKFGKEIGVSVKVFNFPEKIKEKLLKEKIRKISINSDGVIIQLPIPKNFSTDEILNCIPIDKDIDVLSKKSNKIFASGRLKILPPVVGAIKEVLVDSKISLEGKKIALVGRGRLVGGPLSSWLKYQKFNSTIFDKGDSLNLKNFDIIISGTGEPNLIKKEMIKDDTILIDVGTSELFGKTCGDIDPGCAKKSSLFTPVPGGVGPITIAMIFRNLLTCIKNKNNE
ncbi:MAG: bifunctional 5,10-methylenetetrahydrofolate dehydrogenase/5,10-methenyltetrahydrofolate cyclohydrolase [Candidatus Paceibacterota bacterium]|jgi:methylenetetrahydrofolate dehydrogenase (NADP+)/methenyltetrahydrofolate cyclohydrolase